MAVRIGFDDNRSLGARETGALASLPAFREIILKVYQEKLAGPAPRFPVEMEANIDAYLRGELPPKESTGSGDDKIKADTAKSVLQSTYGCELPANPRNTIYPSKNESGRLILTNE